MLLHELVSTEIFNNTLMILGRSLDKNKNATTAFVEGVFYVKQQTNFSKVKIEKALAYSLAELYGADDNPFASVILVVSTPWYTKLWWKIEDNIRQVSFKNLLSVTVVIVSLHVIFALNKTFSFRGKIFTKYQFDILIDKSIPRMRYIIASETTMSYFNYFPLSIINVFYVVYFIVLASAVVRFNRTGNSKKF